MNDLWVNFFWILLLFIIYHSHLYLFNCVVWRIPPNKSYRNESYSIFCERNKSNKRRRPSIFHLVYFSIRLKQIITPTFILKVAAIPYLQANQLNYYFACVVHICMRCLYVCVCTRADWKHFHKYAHALLFIIRFCVWKKKTKKIFWWNFSLDKIPSRLQNLKISFKKPNQNS